jgi:hypothetical protein
MPCDKPRSQVLRSRRATAFAVVALLSLSAVTSASARSFQNVFASPPPFPTRSYYSAQTSMIAPPMQQAPPIAPLSPHV